MNQNKRHINLGKFLSLVLRHKPETIGLQLDVNGWTEVQTLLDKMNDHGKKINFQTLVEIVENNGKQRYAFDEKRSRIRANQGHSIAINLGYQPVEPPEVLFHGTASRFLDSIFATGLEKRARHHVHLSPDRDTAVNVGQRHGKPVVLQVLASEMHGAGFEFFKSENGVWLTDVVPVRYLRK